MKDKTSGFMSQLNWNEKQKHNYEIRDLVHFKRTKKFLLLNVTGMLSLLKIMLILNNL